MNSIELGENHKRAFWSTVYIIEKLVTELEHELQHPVQRILIQTTRDYPDGYSSQLLSRIQEIKSCLASLASKYNLKEEENSLHQLVESKKSVMWEVLHDTAPGKLKRYGTFPAEHAPEFEADLNRLMMMIENL